MLSKTNGAARSAATWGPGMVKSTAAYAANPTPAMGI